MPTVVMIKLSVEVMPYQLSGAVLTPGIKARTAKRADLHIAPRPGTDGALALAMCKALSVIQP